VEKFDLKKLCTAEVKEQYQLGISKRFAALENIHESEQRNRDWENIKENTKISAKESLGLYEWKQHKLRFDEEGSKVVHQRKQAELQRLQGPNHSNADNLNGRCGSSRHFWNKRGNI
jgi:hypothetical protein